MSKVRIIAEIGENHAGDWALARRMLDEAVRAGADIVKVQSYRGADVAEKDPERDWFTQVQLPDELHFELKAAAERQGVEFVSSPFSLERTRFLCEKVGLKSIKVASSEMLNRPMLEYLNRNAKTVYLSTGLATLEEVREAERLLDRVPDLCILHCVTQYPLEDADANLRAVTALKQAFPGRTVGYSDHTIGITAAVAAVALGAEVIEKHFTVDRSLPGTDHLLSALPEEFKAMVEQVRRVEAMLGQGTKNPSAGELKIREFVRSRFPKTEQALS